MVSSTSAMKSRVGSLFSTRILCWTENYLLQLKRQRRKASNQPAVLDFPCAIYQACPVQTVEKDVSAMNRRCVSSPQAAEEQNSTVRAFFEFQRLLDDRPAMPWKTDEDVVQSHPTGRLDKSLNI